MTRQTLSDTTYHGPVLVFDLDDTLYSESDYAISGYRSISELLPEDMHREAVASMTLALREGRNPMDELAALCTRMGREELIDIPAWVATYRNHTPEIEAYPDVLPFLEQMRRRGVRMALVTDGRSLAQRAKLHALGIEDMFHPDDIFISEETGHPKPDRESFIAIVHRYPEASSFIYVGDNPAKDFLAPETLGWLTALRLSDGRNVHPQEVPADFSGLVIRTLPDLMQVEAIQNAFAL